MSDISLEGSIKMGVLFKFSEMELWVEFFINLKKYLSLYENILQLRNH
jgi:hypothetical protein